MFLTNSLFTILLSLVKSVGVVSSLPIYSLSVPEFKLAKSTFLANFDVPTPVAFLKVRLCYIIR